MIDKNDVWSKTIEPPKSPCINVCSVSSQTGFCLGCFRTIKEIVDWETSTNSEKQLILENCKKRNK